MSKNGCSAKQISQVQSIANKCSATGPVLQWIGKLKGPRTPPNGKIQGMTMFTDELAGRRPFRPLNALPYERSTWTANRLMNGICRARHYLPRCSSKSLNDEEAKLPRPILSLREVGAMLLLGAINSKKYLSPYPKTSASTLPRCYSSAWRHRKCDSSAGLARPTTAAGDNAFDTRRMANYLNNMTPLNTPMGCLQPS